MIVSVCMMLKDSSDKTIDVYLQVFFKLLLLYEKLDFKIIVHYSFNYGIFLIIIAIAITSGGLLQVLASHR